MNQQQSGFFQIEEAGQRTQESIGEIAQYIFNRYLRILQAAHIEDDEYFCHMIQDDISAIVRDIRAVHKSDSESVPPTTIAEELKQDLEDVATFKGSPLEKQAVLYCKRLGINYNKLSDAEFR